jgi:predicted RNase H-like HicB family nuclease
MKTDTIKDSTYYEGLPYTITIRKDDEGDFVARIPELAGCIAHGEDEAAAIANLRSMQRLWIESALNAGNPIPEPESDTMPSGKWVQRVPRRLHKELVAAAKRDNVSLNQLVTSMLSEALAVGNCMHVFEMFLGRIPQLAYETRNPFAVGCWPVHPQEAIVWDMAPHHFGGKMTKKLAHAVKIQSSYGAPEILGEQFQKELKDFQKEQLAGSRR